MSAAPSTSDQSDALVAQLFGDDVRSRIARTFDCMSIAEDEIKRAKKRCPRKARALHAAFGILHPGELVRYSDTMYRAHVRELLARVQRGDDVDVGTDAECLVALSEQSLRAPLASDFAFVMHACFARVFGSEAAARIGDVGGESWPGHADEILRELRRKLSRKRSLR